MFPNKLKKLRKKNNYTLEELANEYNKKYDGKLNKGTISRYENGQQEPMIGVVNNFAKLFNVSTDYLLTDDEKTLELNQSNSLLQQINSLSEDQKDDVLKYIEFIKSK